MSCLKISDTRESRVASRPQCHWIKGLQNRAGSDRRGLLKALCKPDEESAPIFGFDENMV